MMREPMQLSVTLRVADDESGGRNGNGGADGEEALCELNIDGDDMILQSVDDDSHALDMILHQARDEDSCGFRCKCIGCIFALICLICTFSDAALTMYMCLEKPNVLIAEYHTWEFEGPLLVAQALLAVTFSTFATQVVIRGIRVSSKVYFSCLAGLVLVISIISGWIFKEDAHDHEFKDMETAVKYAHRRIQRYITFHEQSPPPWLEEFQRESRCCGLESVYDWTTLWRKPDVPDSCCTSRYEGCGKHFFYSRNSNSSDGEGQNVYLTGCLETATVFSTRQLLLLEQIKFIEAFLVIFIALIWLCCWDRFITQPDPELVLRYVPQVNNDRPLTVTVRSNRNDGENRRLEPTFVSEQLQLRPVESRHSRRGAGDLGRKSEDTLRPKTQDNFQSGDYTDIDPTKAVPLEMPVESNCTSK